MEEGENNPAVMFVMKEKIEENIHQENLSTKALCGKWPPHVNKDYSVTTDLQQCRYSFFKPM